MTKAKDQSIDELFESGYFHDIYVEALRLKEEITSLRESLACAVEALSIDIDRKHKCPHDDSYPVEECLECRISLFKHNALAKIKAKHGEFKEAGASAKT